MPSVRVSGLRELPLGERDRLVYSVDAQQARRQREVAHRARDHLRGHASQETRDRRRQRHLGRRRGGHRNAELLRGDAALAVGGFHAHGVGAGRTRRPRQQVSGERETRRALPERERHGVAVGIGGPELVGVGRSQHGRHDRLGREHRRPVHRVVHAAQPHLGRHEGAIGQVDHLVVVEVDPRVELRLTELGAIRGVDGVGVGEVDDTVAIRRRRDRCRRSTAQAVLRTRTAAAVARAMAAKTPKRLVSLIANSMRTVEQMTPARLLRRLSRKGATPPEGGGQRRVWRKTERRDSDRATRPEAQRTSRTKD